MTSRRTSTTLATIALAIGAMLCASDASACAATKDARPRGCCVRKAGPACGCCKVEKPTAADPAPSRPAPAAIAGPSEAPAVDAPSCGCRGGEPAAPAHRPGAPSQAEPREADGRDVAAPLDVRPAAGTPLYLAVRGRAARSPIYLCTSRLLL